MLFAILIYFRLDIINKDLKEAIPYIAQFDELSSNYGQTLTNHEKLRDTNKAST